MNVTEQVTTCCASWRGLEDIEPALRGFVGRRCSNPSEVDDVVQETLLRAARYRTSLGDPGRLRGWAMSIACNVMRDTVRHEARLPRVEMPAEALEQLESRESEPGCVAEAFGASIGAVGVGTHAALEHLASAMHGMRTQDRRLLRSYYWGKRDCAHAALECGIPLEVAKVRLFRARQRLTRVLRRRFLGESTSAARLADTAPCAVAVAPCSRSRRSRWAC